MEHMFRFTNYTICNRDNYTQHQRDEKEEKREVERGEDRGSEREKKAGNNTQKDAHKSKYKHTDTHTVDSIYLTDLQILSDAGVLQLQQQSLNKEMHSKRQSSPSRIKNKEREWQSKRNK